VDFGIILIGVFGGGVFGSVLGCVFGIVFGNRFREFLESIWRGFGN
jgi:hypothetical protein